jgi:AcrR family transcriptional regulator
MPADAPNGKEGRAGRSGETRDTARVPLAEARERRLHEEPEVRERIAAATLVAAAELGYRQLTVAAVLERCGGYRLQFYRHFANIGEAYEAAYTSHAEKLETRLLEAGTTGGSWRSGLRAALQELGLFAREDPALASGLMLQVHIAGGPALRQRKEVLERLSRAVDSARRETRSRHSPPPLTASFMVGAIEAAVVRTLAKGEPERFERAIPELEQLVCFAYLGDGDSEV